MKKNLLNILLITIIILSTVGCETNQKEDSDNLNFGDPNVVQEVQNMDTLQQGYKYSIVYSADPDIRHFTIADSNNSRCDLTILDTTDSYNVNGISYKVNGYNYLMSLGVSEAEESTFYVSWAYNTQEGSHLDFSIDCEKLESISGYKEANAFVYTPNYPILKSKFFDSTDKTIDNINSDLRISSMYGNNFNTYSNVDWTGVSLKLNNTIVEVYETGANNIVALENLNKIELQYDIYTKDVEIIIYDYFDNEISRISKTNIEPKSGNSVELSVEVAAHTVNETYIKHSLEVITTLD